MIRPSTFASCAPRILLSTLLLGACSSKLLVGEDTLGEGGGSDSAGDSGATGTDSASSSSGGASDSGGPTTAADPTATATSLDTGDSSDCRDGVAWARHITIGEQNGTLRDLVVDAEGNLIAVGTFWLTGEFGGEPLQSAGVSDGFIAKFGPGGEHLWSRRFGDANEQEVLRVALADDGSIVVSGKFRGVIDLGGGPLTSVGYDDIFVARLTAAGDHVWSHGFGAAEVDFGVDVAADSAGNVLLFAGASGPVDFGAGAAGTGNAGHLVKFDPAGAHLWHRVFDGDPELLPRGVAVGPDDHVVVVGSFSATVDFGGGPEVGAGAPRLFIVKFDPDGGFQWLRRSESAVPDVHHVNGVETDDAGNLHIGGTFASQLDLGGPVLQSTNPVDAWSAVLLPDGAHLWSRLHAVDAGEAHTVDVAANGSGDTAVTGRFTGTISLGGAPFTNVGNGYDAFVGRFALDGAHLDSRAFGGPNALFGDVVAIGEDGSVWLGGVFDTTFEVGGQMFAPSPDDKYDSYLIRLCP